MSVNYARPQKCTRPGCNRSAEKHGTRCWEHYQEDFRTFEEQRAREALEQLTNEDTQELPAWNTDCAAMFDAQGNQVNTFPIRPVRSNGRNE